MELEVSRRKVMECMAWGPGVVWALVAGIPQAFAMDELGNGGADLAAVSSFSFAQISDSHIGFDKAANPDSSGTFRDGLAILRNSVAKPSFLIHTGDITHLSKADQFDTAAQMVRESGFDTHYVPGEHDMVDEDNGKLYMDRFGKGTKGAGWYSFNDHGVHFIGLVNVVDLKAGGMGNLGQEQLAWLKNDLSVLSASTPIVVFAHIPLWTVYEQWGWGTQDSAEAISYMRRFGSVTILNGHIHQVMQKVEGNVSFHTARATGFAQPAPGTAPAPGPMVVPAGQLRNYLGVTTVSVTPGQRNLMINDTTLA